MERKLLIGRCSFNTDMERKVLMRRLFQHNMERKFLIGRMFQHKYGKKISHWKNVFQQKYGTNHWKKSTYCCEIPALVKKGEILFF